MSTRSRFAGTTSGADGRRDVAGNDAVDQRFVVAGANRELQVAGFLEAVEQAGAGDHEQAAAAQPGAPALAMGRETALATRTQPLLDRHIVGPALALRPRPEAEIDLRTHHSGRAPRAPQIAVAHLGEKLDLKGRARRRCLCGTAPYR